MYTAYSLHLEVILYVFPRTRNQQESTVVKKVHILTSISVGRGELVLPNISALLLR